MLKATINGKQILLPQDEIKYVEDRGTFVFIQTHTKGSYIATETFLQIKGQVAPNQLIEVTPDLSPTKKRLLYSPHLQNVTQRGTGSLINFKSSGDAITVQENPAQVFETLIANASDLALRSLWVDGINGDNNTGQKGNHGQPYKDLWYVIEQNIAQSGDTIYVSGLQNLGGLADTGTRKWIGDGLRIISSPGTIFNLEADSSSQPFYDEGIAISCEFLGWPTLGDDRTLPAYGGLIVAGNLATKMHLQIGYHEAYVGYFCEGFGALKIESNQQALIKHGSFLNFDILVAQADFTSTLILHFPYGVNHQTNYSLNRAYETVRIVGLSKDVLDLQMQDIQYKNDLTAPHEGNFLFNVYSFGKSSNIILVNLNGDSGTTNGRFFSTNGELKGILQFLSVYHIGGSPYTRNIYLANTTIEIEGYIGGSGTDWIMEINGKGTLKLDLETEGNINILGKNRRTITITGHYITSTSGPIISSNGDIVSVEGITLANLILDGVLASHAIGGSGTPQAFLPKYNIINCKSNALDSIDLAYVDGNGQNIEVIDNDPNYSFTN